VKPIVSPERAVHDQPGRGREADDPTEIPVRGWWDVLWRVKQQLADDNVSIVAAGLALFALLAVFPGFAAAVAIYGLFSSPAQIGAQVQLFGSLLPEAGLRILEAQLSELASQRDTLSVGLVVGIVVALWSARQGMTALMAATNVAYNERERRTFFKQLLISLVLTVGAVFAFMVVVILGVAVPLALNFLPLGNAAATVLLVIRWILLWVFASLALSAVYRFAPSRTEAQWRWVSWGSGIAATLWILCSVGFAFYLRFFNSYNKVYGAVGGVAIMLMWLYISGFVLILGAEINSELERQTVKDTTKGQPKPMGERGAFSADTLGPSASQS
jgi:membrane protein